MLYNQPFGESNPDAPYVDRNTPAAIAGSVPPAAAIEHPQREIVAAIAAAGLTPSKDKLDQIAQAMTRHASGGVYYIDSGAANAYVLAITGAFKAPTVYFDGMEIVFTPAAANTGAATVNVAALGIKSLVRPDGSALLPDDVSGMTVARYHAASGKFRLLPWSQPTIPQYFLADHSANYSAPYDTWLKQQGTAVRNTLGATWSNSEFTAPSDGLYQLVYRVSMTSGGFDTQWQSAIDATAAPGNPFGAIDTLWRWTASHRFAADFGFVGMYGSGLIQLAAGQKISVRFRFMNSNGSGAQTINDGKLGIFLLR